MQNYNVLFMGTSKFAVPILEGLLESSVNIQAVFSAPPKLANRGMKKTLSPVAKFAEEYQLPLEYPTSLKDPEIINKINELNPDIIFVIAYGYILPKEIIDIPKLGCFNLHGSLLPKYRGAAPIQRSSACSCIAEDRSSRPSCLRRSTFINCSKALSNSGTPLYPSPLFWLANPSQFRGAPITAAHSALMHDVGLPYRIGKTICPADSARAQTVVNHGASVRAY